MLVGQELRDTEAPVTCRVPSTSSVEVSHRAMVPVVDAEPARSRLRLPPRRTAPEMVAEDALREEPPSIVPPVHVSEDTSVIVEPA